MTTFDAYVQHQVYVEGYKNGQAQDAETLYEEITAAVLIVLNKLQIDNLSELTKRQLNQLVKTITAKVKELFGKQVELTLADIKRFMAADLGIMSKLTKDAAGNDAPVNAINQDRLWSNIINAPVAGVGMEPTTVLTDAQTAAVAAIVQLVKSAWADAVSLSDLLKALVGTRSLNYRDGLLTRHKRRFVTAINTIVQHVASEVQFRLGALTSSHYVWCSILDSRTTDICRSRNGKAYKYGEGPRPPAHWNCRSFTIPATIVQPDEMPTFYTWVKRQPAYIQDDTLGPARGKDLRDGRIKSDDLPAFDRARPLTVSEYGDRVNKILNEVA